MRVTARTFASLRELSTDRCDLELTDGGTLEDAWRVLAAPFPGTRPPPPDRPRPAARGARGAARARGRSGGGGGPGPRGTVPRRRAARSVRARRAERRVCRVGHAAGRRRR